MSRRYQMESPRKLRTAEFDLDRLLNRHLACPIYQFLSFPPDRVSQSNRLSFTNNVFQSRSKQIGLASQSKENTRKNRARLSICASKHRVFRQPRLLVLIRRRLRKTSHLPAEALFFLALYWYFVRVRRRAPLSQPSRAFCFYFRKILPVITNVPLSETAKLSRRRRLTNDEDFLELRLWLQRRRRFQIFT